MSGAGGIWAQAVATGINAVQNRRAQNMQHDQWARSFYDSVYYRVLDARRAGIHPIYAMGQPAHGGGAAIQGSPGVDNSAIAHQLGNRETQQLRNDLLREQVRAQKLKNDDFVNNQRASSAIAGATQAINSRQDTEAYIELEADRVPRSASHSQYSGPGGRVIRGQLGDYAYRSDQPSAQQLEDQAGEIVAMVESTLISSAAWGRYKNFKKEAYKRYPDKRSGRVRTNKQRAADRRHNAKQKWRRAKYLQKRLKLFTQEGR